MKKSFFIFICIISIAHSEIAQREGKGFLEIINGQKILHLKGAPYEMGFQHGKLMRASIKDNVEKYLDQKSDEAKEKSVKFGNSIPKLLSHLPEKYLEEMKGVSDGSGIEFKKIVFLNLFPEMFHCSAITAKGNATENGEIYHVRVLDYAVGKGLQKSAVIIVQSPDFGNSFVNISYAGFIGSVTGMNEQKISVGEIGAKGYGNWDGVPMTFIMREILESASDITMAKKILTEVKRTCHYFYIVSDGNSKSSFAAFAKPDKISFIEPGENYKFSKNGDIETSHYDQFFETAYEKIFTDQKIMKTSDGNPSYVLQGQHQDILSLMGFTHEPYPVLYSRLKKYYGKINEQFLIEVIKCPVARESNLHNVIFASGTGDFWVAHAGENDTPACHQNYFHLNIFELLQR